MNKCILISGNSGSGKSTFAILLSHILNQKKTLILSGDDSHLWERDSDNWNSFTHLNPNANNLLVGHQQVIDLIGGKPIIRDVYNHAVGKFNKNVLIEPKEFIIYEGLHALYDKDLISKSYISIFMDTDEELCIEWKVKRDIYNRGYTKNDVLEKIAERQSDEKKYIQCQKDNADVIIKFIKKNNKTKIEAYFRNSKNEDLIKEVILFYNELVTFVNICNKLSINANLYSGLGGNISVKFGNKLLITESGSTLHNVSLTSGYCVCDVSKAFPSFINDNDYLSYIDEINLSSRRPSMEIGAHIKNSNTAVVHTHPFHLNAILCSGNSKEILSKIFKDYKYRFIKYESPGLKLSNLFTTGSEKIIFLENHGLIAAATSLKKALNISCVINRLCKKWIISNIDISINDSKITDGKLFPDSVVYEDMSLVNKNLIKVMNKIKVGHKFLNIYECDIIKNMSLEQYRKDAV